MMRNTKKVLGVALTLVLIIGLINPMRIAAQQGLVSPDPLDWSEIRYWRVEYVVDYFQELSAPMQRAIFNRLISTEPTESQMEFMEEFLLHLPYSDMFWRAWGLPSEIPGRLVLTERTFFTQYELREVIPPLEVREMYAGMAES